MDARNISTIPNIKGQSKFPFYHFPLKSIVLNPRLNFLCKTNFVLIKLLFIVSCAPVARLKYQTSDMGSIS